MELDGTIIYANNASLVVARSPEWVTVEEYALGKKIKNFIFIIISFRTVRPILCGRSMISLKTVPLI